MATDVSIFNQAMGLLRANKVTSFSDGTKEAQLATDHYNDLRDAVLEEADWTFAKRRYNIAADATAPAWGWSTRYLIPDEVIRVIRVNGNSVGKKWEREGQYVLTDYGTCEMEAIERITNPNFYFLS